MFFLLRMAFWLSIVLILLPTGSAQRTPNEVAPSEAISAASATVQDVRGFCARQPDACSVGSQMASEIGYKLQAGAKMLYDFLTHRAPTREAGSSGGPAAHGAGNIVFDKSWSLRGSQDTLTPADLAPAWRGPSVHTDAKPAA